GGIIQCTRFFVHQFPITGGNDECWKGCLKGAGWSHKSSYSYRQRFRSLDVNPKESPKELYARFKELYGCSQKVKENFILEQYLRIMFPELQVWICEHDPDSAMEAARLANVFIELYHSYADDTQLYLSFPPEDATIATKISACLSDISAWMSERHLQLNLSKTEILIFPGNNSPQQTFQFKLDRYC
uniref:SCAN box domain-containing protein n=1 Tax=Denticeps clupeoides TaxID=299321 RepID=A0AAY4AHS6_9TELE